VGARALAAAALAALLAACSGPHATTSDTRVQASTRPGFYRVEVRVHNSGGTGQVELTVRLHNKESGRIVTHTQSVDLQPHDRADVAMEVPAPPGDYTAEVSVAYPPR
jgi:ABC-type uncharacterized transport system auxiliary subunit